ncbi:hypothetical protein HanXRQr2_Chr01g0004341 [Helianthus annuus]|uniref:Uncharacterized protein n=1 Tax=Helianthus annuus TaxID=4232 RepID=A0A9K3P362_HELAN|nr:hypothetical protein HanXRQr2_Chr01g0004341 [Helianthus annuus]KAJ0638521.1 hypothetical protein HanHA300_Chr00c0102g0709791 [Helianthus annuus]KAJ0817020.1 hypothetical protein HanLR1_Chr00c0478g0753331 [Helianthus annuus]
MGISLLNQMLSSDFNDYYAVKYEGYLLEKYGEESSQHRELDKELWYEASGGKKRGKVYGLSNVKNDFNVQHHGKQGQEVCLFF